MFTDKKEDNQKETKPEAVFDPNNIPVHTMQDDVDMLEGKIVTVNQPVSSAPPIPPVSPAFRAQSTQAVKNENLKVPVSSPDGNSPFLRNASSSVSGVPANAISPKIGDFRPKEEVVSAPKEEIHPASSHNWVRISGILVLVVALLGVLGGGYYFYMTRYNVPTVDIQTPEEVAETVDTVPEVEPEPITIPEKFSADKPNYLMIDVENAGTVEIQKLIKDKAAEMIEDGKTVPIDFVVVDQNNNPIALKIFSLLMKINLSQKMLDNLSDEFSLIIYNDQANVRLGLALSPKNSVTLAAQMKVEEKTLVKTLEPLFLGEKTKSPAGTFSDSQEGNVAIRYINLNDQKNLSVDYWIEDGKLFLATSKATGRAIMAKMTNSGL